MKKLVISIWSVCLVVILVGGGLLIWNSLRYGGAQTAPDVRPTPDVKEPSPPREQTEVEKVRAMTFFDVSADAPYRDAVCYAAYKGYLTGVGDGAFDPDGLPTNATASTVLKRMVGEDSAVWEFKTCPDVITRHLLATLLKSIAVRLALDAPNTEVTDVDEYTVVASSAADIMTWAQEMGLFNGIITGRPHPELAISRAQLAQALLNLDALRPGGDLARELLETNPPAPAEAYALDQKTLDELQSAVDASVKRNRAVGAQVAIIKGGDVIATLNSGWATKNADVMDDDSKMRVASISKVAVGMGAMALAEDGAVDLDAPVGNYWGASFVNPYYPDDPVTLWNIMNHTSSIWPAGDNVSRAYSQVKSLLSTGRGYTDSRPGDISSWYYNNYAFSVLGMTLELATDKTMDQIMDEQFFDALGVDAAFEAGSVSTPDTLVTLYREDGTTWRSASELRTVLLDPTPGANGRYFAGGFTISAADLGKLVAVLANDGTYQGLRLLSERSVAAMEERSAGLVADGESYQAFPLDYRENLYGRQGLYYHNGNAFGAFTCASYDPLTGDGAVVLVTGSNPAKVDGIYTACSDINAAVYPALASAEPEGAP